MGRGCKTLQCAGMFWGRVQYSGQNRGLGQEGGGGGHGKNCLGPASGKSARALLASVDDILGLSLSSPWDCCYHH